MHKQIVPYVIQSPVRKFNSVLLIIVTAFFLLVGVSVIYFTYTNFRSINSCNVGGDWFKNNDIINNFEEGSVCKCTDGVVVCSKIVQENKLPQISDFRRDKLKTVPKYISSGTKEALTTLPLKTTFTSVSKKQSVISISIQQEQKCSDDSRIPVQIGMYYIAGDNLYITNIVNKDKKFVDDCIVAVNYEISGINKDVEYKIKYMSEDGDSFNANICSLKNNIYLEGDIYSAVDNCNICKCESGISKCTNDRVCTK